MATSNSIRVNRGVSFGDLSAVNVVQRLQKQLYGPDASGVGGRPRWGQHGVEFQVGPSGDQHDGSRDCRVIYKRSMRRATVLSGSG